MNHLMFYYDPNTSAVCGGVQLDSQTTSHCPTHWVITPSYHSIAPYTDNIEHTHIPKMSELSVIRLMGEFVSG